MNEAMAVLLKLVVHENKNFADKKVVAIMDYLREIKKEFPKIKAHMENDFDWVNEASELVTKRKLKEAETIYKKLCLSQPEHHSGFEGLAEIYAMRNQKSKAVWFMKEAIERAKKFLEDDSIDQEVIDEMEEKCRKINSDERYAAYDSVTPDTVAKTGKIGRNDPCPCDSGKKYKKCCGK